MIGIAAASFGFVLLQLQLGDCSGRIVLAPANQTSSSHICSV